MGSELEKYEEWHLEWVIPIVFYMSIHTFQFTDIKMYYLLFEHLRNSLLLWPDMFLHKFILVGLYDA